MYVEFSSNLLLAAFAYKKTNKMTMCNSQFSIMQCLKTTHTNETSDTKNSQVILFFKTRFTNFSYLQYTGNQHTCIRYFFLSIILPAHFHAVAAPVSAPCKIEPQIQTTCNKWWQWHHTAYKLDKPHWLSLLWWLNAYFHLFMCLPSTVLIIKTFMGSSTLDATCLRHVRVLTTELYFLMATWDQRQYKYC